LPIKEACFGEQCESERERECVKRIKKKKKSCDGSSLAAIATAVCESWE